MDPGAEPLRVGGVPVPPVPPVPDGGRLEEVWKRHVVRQLKHRDRTQSSMFQDLTRFCKVLSQLRTKLHSETSSFNGARPNRFRFDE